MENLYLFSAPYSVGPYWINISEKNFDFWTQFSFLIKISIFEQNFRFWPAIPNSAQKSQFRTEENRNFDQNLIIKSRNFYQNRNFAQNIQILSSKWNWLFFNIEALRFEISLKIEFLVKNRNFDGKLKFCSKIESVFFFELKLRNFKWKFEITVKKQSFSKISFKKWLRRSSSEV